MAAVLVDFVFVLHGVDGLLHEVEVLVATDVPCVAIASEVCLVELICFDEFIQLVSVLLRLRVLVHAMGDDHERHVVRHSVWGEDEHVALQTIDSDVDAHLLVCIG